MASLQATDYTGLVTDAERSVVSIQATSFFGFSRKKNNFLKISLIPVIINNTIEYRFMTKYSKFKKKLG